jgi:DNA-directed RNA polymerase specialized sigma24 family protein
MRRILVDHARARHHGKRGGETEKVSLEDATGLTSAEGVNIDLIALDDALKKLAKMDEQKARIVELLYISGLSVRETAGVMSVSTDTRSNATGPWLRRGCSGSSSNDRHAMAKNQRDLRGRGQTRAR